MNIARFEPWPYLDAMNRDAQRTTRQERAA